MKLLKPQEGAKEQIKTFLSFLMRLAPQGAVLPIVSIKFEQAADKRLHLKFVTASEINDDLYTYVLSEASIGWNMYAQPTLLRTKPKEGRGSKTLVLGGSLLWVDIDLSPEDRPFAEKFLEKYKAANPAPTLINFTGRGFHIYWALDTFVENYKDIEARNVALKNKFGGDDCWDAVHILRVPGTWNFKKEFTNPSEVKIVHYAPENVYKLSDFPLASPENIEDDQDIIVQEEALPENFLSTIPSELKERIVHGPVGTMDRSGNDWYVAKALVELGYTAGQVYSVFMTAEWSVGEKGQQNNQYVVKTILKAVNEHKKVIARRPSAILQPIIEKHLIYRDKSGAARIDLPAQGLPVIKEAVDFLVEKGYKFLYDGNDKVPYIITNDGSVIRAVANSREYTSWISHITLFTADSRAFRMFQTGFIAYITATSNVGSIKPWSYLDPESNIYYLLLDHMHNRDILVLPIGKQPETVSNGTANVILTSSPRTHGKNIEWSEDFDFLPVLSELFDLTYDNFPVHDDMKRFLIAYMFAVPIAGGLIDQGTLPLLHLTGGYGQGKTDTLKTLSAFIHGITALESGTTQASIHALAHSDIFIPFDDYERLPPHLQEFILTNASGAVRHKMDLETSGTVSQQSHVLLALTSIGELETNTLRRRAVQVTVSSSTWGRKDFDDSFKDKLLRNRSIYWNAYVHFLSKHLLTTVNRSFILNRSKIIADGIKVQEFKPLAQFLAICITIAEQLAKVDIRFSNCLQTGYIDLWCQQLGIDNDLAFEGFNPLIDPLTEFFEALKKSFKTGQAPLKNGLSVSGAAVLKSLGDGLTLEEPVYCHGDLLPFSGEDCLVVCGLPTSWATKLTSRGNKDLFKHEVNPGALFSKYIKMSIGTNNVKTILKHKYGRRQVSDLKLIPGSNIWVQYVYGVSTNGKGSCWRVWYPLDKEEISSITKPKETAPTDPIAKVMSSIELLIKQNKLDKNSEKLQKLAQALLVLKDISNE